MSNPRLKPKVLIVDDRPENLMILEDILETIDVEVVRAGSGKEAISKAKDHELALILMDVQMPGMDGFETASIMRDNDASRSTPLIFITALDPDEQFMTRGYEVGAVDYLNKPISPKIVRSKVKAFVAMHRDRQNEIDQAGRGSDAHETRQMSPEERRTVSGPFAGELPDQPIADRYKILRELGAGGMATVFLAEDQRQPRQVAIKVLNQKAVEAMQMASSGASEGSNIIRRFLREIRISANLNHPHIIPLFESGVDKGVPYFVMPAIDGGTVKDLVRGKGPLPVEQAIGIAREVAGALHYAHGEGIIHRDIKPANIMMSNGHAIVADFGIALAFTDPDSSITKTGYSIGTPAYMSPEQALATDTDSRCDIYSLGCVLYEMLRGQPPFVGPTAAAIAAQTLTETAESLLEIRTDVPTELEPVIQRAMEKMPEDRYQTAEEFGEALKPFG